MPIYEYRCKSCGYEFEEVQKFNDLPVDNCPECGQMSVERKVSMSSFHLKGGGWYKDGYSNENLSTEKSDKEKLSKDKNSSVVKDSESSKKSDKTEKSDKNEKKESTYKKKTTKEKAA